MVIKLDSNSKNLSSNLGAPTNINIMGYIYIIKNRINDKVYIGKTDLDINKRFKEHVKDSRRRRCEKRPLYSAMRKYGCEHFYVELIEET